MHIGEIEVIGKRNGRTDGPTASTIADNWKFDRQELRIAGRRRCMSK